VSRIERQRDGTLAALLIGRAASLGMIVALEEGWVNLEQVLMEPRVAGCKIFIAITMCLELLLRILSAVWSRVEEESG
jgi:hypothetical protein